MVKTQRGKKAAGPSKTKSKEVRARKKDETGHTAERRNTSKAEFRHQENLSIYESRRELSEEANKRTSVKNLKYATGNDLNQRDNGNYIGSSKHRHQIAAIAAGEWQATQCRPQKKETL